MRPVPWIGPLVHWRLALRAIALAAVLAPAAVRAGGYDTPMLYSARHLGMGGTAVGYVSDPSALFHNPAGLGHVGRLTVLGDFSLLMAKIRSSPGLGAQDVESGTTIAPMFLLGAGYRVSNWLTLGLGIFPNASAGATYEYPVGDGITENKTRLVFIEATPAAAVNLPGNVRLGLGYRVTYVSLERLQGGKGVPTKFLDFGMTGVNLFGLRAGAQWTPLDWLQLGAAYRHRVTTKVKNDRGIAVGFPYTDIETTFVLPSKATLGGRADLGDVGIALDGEYLFNSQNDSYPLIGTDSTGTRDPAGVPNVYGWKDEVTVRVGLEYRLLPALDGHKRLALRAGYVFDGQTTSAQYPSAFGTPPGPTQLVTTGAGWRFSRWQLNLAYALRFGEGDVRPEDLTAPGRRACAFCGVAGAKPYRLRIHGLYLDASFATD